MRRSQSHAETCSIKKVGTAHHAEGTSSERRLEWLAYEPRWAETQERAVVRSQVLDHGQTFGLYSECSEKPLGMEGVVPARFVLSCESILFD